MSPLQQHADTQPRQRLGQRGIWRKAFGSTLMRSNSARIILVGLVFLVLALLMIVVARA